MGTIASAFVIPDYFPPENFLLSTLMPALLFTDISECAENFSPVHFGQSCLEHDRCYATLGSKKDECDDTLLDGWLESCAQTYNGGGAESCLNACELMVNIMFAGLRFQTQDFCPSCKAFERAQEHARRLH